MDSTLGAVAALALWSMAVTLWMYVTRIGAMRAMPDIDIKQKRGGTGKDLDTILPPEVQWKAHNHNHLMEQPTVFYAVAIALAIAGQGAGLNAMLAWGYVGLRIVHSLIQATINRVLWRFAVYALATVLLTALCVHAFLTLVVWG